MTAASLELESETEPPPNEDEWARDDRLATGTEYLSSVACREMRDDRVLFFVEHLAAGMYHHRSLSRATTFRSFSVPPPPAPGGYTPPAFTPTGSETADGQATPPRPLPPRPPPP